MKKNLIAAAVLAAMCSGAQASEKALEALGGLAGEGQLKETFISVPAAAPAERWGGTSVYVNDAGCTVTAEQRTNGVTLYVQDGGGRQASLGYLSDFSGGDIFSFCSPARADLQGGRLTLSCGEQDNGGYPTRGAAAIEMKGGITSVSVRGEVRRLTGWRTDTEIYCGGLRPVRAGAEAGLSGTYRLSDGYNTATLTVREQAGAGKLGFSLLAVSGSGNTGELEGVASRGQNGDFVFRGRGGCELTLRAGAGKFEVSGGDMTCGDHLGLNVAVDGEYLRK